MSASTCRASGSAQPSSSDRSDVGGAARLPKAEMVPVWVNERGDGYEAGVDLALASGPGSFPWGSQLATAADCCFAPIVSRESASATADRWAVSARGGAG